MHKTRAIKWIEVAAVFGWIPTMTAAYWLCDHGHPYAGIAFIILSIIITSINLGDKEHSHER